MKVNTQIIEITLHKKRSDLKSGKTGLKPAQPEGPRQADLQVQWWGCWLQERVPRERKNCRGFCKKGFARLTLYTSMSADVVQIWPDAGKKCILLFRRRAAKPSCWKHQSLYVFWGSNGHVLGEITEWRTLSRPGPIDETVGEDSRESLKQQGDQTSQS